MANTTALLIATIITISGTSLSCSPAVPYLIKEIRAANKTIASLGLTAENFPVLDGATSTQPVRGLIAAAAFGGKEMFLEVSNREMFAYADLSGTGLTREQQETVQQKYGRNSKTHDAYLRIINGTADLILVSTLPSEDEAREAKKAGIELELFPIGLDGFIFLVNENNPVTNLTTGDIVNIYRCGIQNWRELGGPDAPIIAFTRQPNSGSQELMEKLVMKNEPLPTSLRIETENSMAGLVDAVEFNDKSIGFTHYYYKVTMIDHSEKYVINGKRLFSPAKIISINGFEPGLETIASGKYPYIFNIYAVTRTNQPKDSKAYQIKEWLTGPEGQALVEKAGYVTFGK
jgi:phosphate transport system substrate-binding protein